jgi:hypothetical protein
MRTVGHIALVAYALGALLFTTAPVVAPAAATPPTLTYTVAGPAGSTVELNWTSPGSTWTTWHSARVVLPAGGHWSTSVTAIGWSGGLNRPSVDAAIIGVFKPPSTMTCTVGRVVSQSADGDCLARI